MNNLLECLEICDKTLLHFSKDKDYEIVQLQVNKEIPCFHILVYNVKHEVYEIYYMGYKDLNLCYYSYDIDDCDEWLVNHSV